MEKDDRVMTPHGMGTVVGLETVNDNCLFPNKPTKLVHSGRYEVFMDDPPYNYNPMYFWKKDLEVKNESN